MGYQFGSSTPLLQLVGASSPHADGTADTSIGGVIGPRPKVGFSSDRAFQDWFYGDGPTDPKAPDPLEHLLHGAPAPTPSFNVPAGGDAARAKAEETARQGGDAWLSALNQPVPEYHTPRLNPLQTGLALLIAGGLNAASPYTSEGSRAGQAFLSEQDRQAQQEYQNRMQAYQARQRQGQAQYQVGQDLARPLYDQATAADQAHIQGQMAQDQAMQQARIASWTGDRQNAMAIFQHRADMDRLHQEFAQQVDLLGRQNAFTTERDVQERLFQLTKDHPEARGALLTDTLLKHGYTPAEAQRLGKAIAQQTPQEAEAILRNELLGYQVKSAKIDLQNKPQMDAIDMALKRAQLGHINAEIAAARAGVNLTNRQADTLGTMTPNQKADWFANQYNAANQNYIKALIDRTSYVEKWNQTNGSAFPRVGPDGKVMPLAKLEEDPTYMALTKALQEAKIERDQWAAAGNQVIIGSNPAPGNSLRGPIGSGGKTEVLPGFPPGIEVTKVGG